MIKKAAEVQPTDADSSWKALQWVHRLLWRPTAEQGSLPDVLNELATAFDAQAAELRPLSGEGFRLRCGIADTGWEPTGEWPQRIQRSRLAVAVPLPVGGQGLATRIRLQDQPDWLLWVEDARRSTWNDAEAGALTLAGQVLERWLLAGERSAWWVQQQERYQQQQRLEIAANMARKLAHDLGNVFTGILGFTELSLAHPTPTHALIHSYMNEVYRSAQNGARLTHQLRLFSRRHQGNDSCSSLPAILQEQLDRLQRNADHRDQVQVEVPHTLPAVAMDSEHLNHLVAALLDNAVEAAPRPSQVTVTAQLVDLDAPFCGDYYGDLKPGRFVALTIADRGPGLTADQRQRVVVEPLFTTKARHRGLGLAVVYGILHSHQGGFRMRPRPEGGVEVEVVLPVTASRGTAARAVAAEENPKAAKVLVVDDDPLVLSLVRTTLEQAGYRVLAVESAEEALHSFTAATLEPFQLVLSDIAMPRVTGLELARQLLQRDANVRMLFMSGHVDYEVDQLNFPNRFDLLAKPFRPEGLLEAVRTAFRAQE